MVPKEAIDEDGGIDVDVDAGDSGPLCSYTRRPEHDAWLAKVIKLTDDELLTALAIARYTQEGYIPSEVLVTLARNNYGTASRVQSTIALALNKRLVIELGRFFSKEINWLGVLNRSSESSVEAVQYVIEHIFGSTVEVSYAEISFAPYVKMRLLDWFKSQIALKNSAPSVDGMTSPSDEDGGDLSLTDQVEDEYTLTPDKALERKQLIHACRAALLKLPEKQRTAVTLVYLQDMTHKQAGDVMGLSESSVQKYVKGAILALKKGNWHV
jgi:RNA polymerase sigma factor (sigma-70 family)